MASMEHEYHAASSAEVVGWSDDRLDRALRIMFRLCFPGRGVMDRLPEGTKGQVLHPTELVGDGMCVIRAEMPGLDLDKDVEVSVRHSVWTLQARREGRKEDHRSASCRSEFQYGSFLRRIPSCKDGILEGPRDDADRSNGIEADRSSSSAAELSDGSRLASEPVNA